MLNRLLFVFLLFIVVAGFSALNWTAIAASTTISFGVVSVDAPLGMVLLGFTVVLLLVFVGYMAVWQGQILMETRHHQNELREQRLLVDQTEASRFTELRTTMLAEFQTMAAQLQQGEATSSRELREHANSLAAMLGEMDDRAKKSG